MPVEDLPLADPAANPERATARKLTVDRLRAAMGELGERCQLLKYKLQGKSFPETQKLMKAASINTVYTWDSRCRKELLERMGGSWEIMRPDEARKLLGGYATGTLTPEEQQQLFAAALEDQELFNELAQEQVLRETLDDPGARAELLAAVTERKQSWLRWWPVPVGAGALALAAITVMLLVPRQRPEAVQVAQNEGKLRRRKLRHRLRNRLFPHRPRRPPGRNKTNPNQFLLRLFPPTRRNSRRRNDGTRRLP